MFGDNGLYSNSIDAVSVIWMHIIVGEACRADWLYEQPSNSCWSPIIWLVARSVDRDAKLAYNLEDLMRFYYPVLLRRMFLYIPCF